MNNSAAPELNPCPFAHTSEQERSRSGDPYATTDFSEDEYWCVTCPICRASTALFPERADAQRAWNARAPKKCPAVVDGSLEQRARVLVDTAMNERNELSVASYGKLIRDIVYMVECERADLPRAAADDPVNTRPEFIAYNQAIEDAKEAIRGESLLV